jgi:hypothetical protein
VKTNVKASSQLFEIFSNRTIVYAKGNFSELKRKFAHFRSIFAFCEKEKIFSFQPYVRLIAKLKPADVVPILGTSSESGHEAPHGPNTNPPLILML